MRNKERSTFFVDGSFIWPIFWQPGLEKRSPLFDRSATNQKDDSGNQQKIWREKFFDDPRRLPEFGFVDYI